MKRADPRKGEVPSKKRQASGNAFEMLMQKRPSAQRSRFVACPAGCGSHILEQNVNEHLDRCLDSSEAVDPPVPQSETKATEQEDVKSAKKWGPTCPEQLTLPKTPEESSSPTASPQSNSSNVFLHMMKQSHRVFSAKESQPLAQQFHLHLGEHLTWTCMEDPRFVEDTKSVQWSSKVLLKASRMFHGQPQPKPDASQLRDVELTISTSLVCSGTPQRRLVRRHSRLSVPVLKSILQKSIRRRRPLPAVRVAMELVDKALGELLRRLPIIILEDSMLHPDLPLLVWLMVAESKDYMIPPQLITRVVQIVYEMASCPWTDYIGDNPSTVIAKEKNDLIILSSPIPWVDCNQRLDECSVLIRSILLRAQYGGMAGDMQMLHDYVHLWFKRMDDVHVPTDVAERVSQRDKADVSLPTESLTEFKWCDVPTLIHARAKLQSQSHVPPIVQRGLDKLSMQDICCAGVDFHCSAVLDQAIAEDAVFEECYERISSIVTEAGLSPLPTSKDQRRPYLMRILKQCMWKFSSGINHRQPVFPQTPMKQDEHELALKRFWKDSIADRVESYMKKYIEDRLVP